MIQKVLDKFKLSTGSTLSLVVPKWENKAWHKELMKLSIEPPLPLDHYDNLFLPKNTGNKYGVGKPKWKETEVWRLKSPLKNRTASIARGSAEISNEDAMDSVGGNTVSMLAREYRGSKPLEKRLSTPMRTTRGSKPHAQGLDGGDNEDDWVGGGSGYRRPVKGVKA